MIRHSLIDQSQYRMQNSFLELNQLHSLLRNAETTVVIVVTFLNIWYAGITLSHDQELHCHMTKNYFVTWPRIIVTWSGSTLSHDQEYMSHMIKELYYFCFGHMINVSNSIYFNLYLGFQVSKFRNTCRYIVVFWNKTINQFWEEISLTETLYIYISYLLF